MLDLSEKKCRMGLEDRIIILIIKSSMFIDIRNEKNG